MNIEKIGTPDFTGRYAARTLVDVASLARRKTALKSKLAKLYEQLKTAAKNDIPSIEKQIKNVEIQILSLEEQAYRATT